MAATAPRGPIVGFESAPCPRCGSSEAATVHSGADFLHRSPGVFYVARCSGCDLLFQNPRPTPERISRYYPADYLPHRESTGAETIPEMKGWKRRYLSTALGYRHLAATPAAAGSAGTVDYLPERLKAWRTGCDLIPRFVPGGRVLEIGCANGDRLAALRELGWKDLHGIELVDQAAELARKRGFEVITGPIEEHLADLPDDSFDVVIASMVLEHLYDPFGIVRLVARKLKPGGEFLFSTIVCDSLDARIYGRYSAGFDFPRHLVFFRKNDIDLMLEPNFREVQAFYQSAPIDYIRSSSWRVEHGDGSLFDRLVIGYGKTKVASYLGLALAYLKLTCRVSFRCSKRSMSSAPKPFP